MAMSNDPLSFFVLEAGDCLEHLDAVLAGAGPAGPDATEFVRYARTLRGAAIMHKLTGMADLAHAVERAGRALRDGTTQWTPALAAGLVAAVDDLKILLHNLRIWGPNEEARAARRLADLAQFVPGVDTSGVRGSETGGGTFLATEMTETAAALEPLAHAAGDAGDAALQGALGRVRTLRGIAGIHDVPPVPDVLDAVERLARTLAIAPTAPTTAQMALFGAAAALLRRTGTDLRTMGRSAAGTPEERRFVDAADALASAATDADPIVPIDQLFFDDGNDGVVAPASRPPTTRAERFRLEVVSMAEHLRALVRDAQAGEAGAIPDRIVLELRRALRDVHRAAESFGERDIAGFLTTFMDDLPVFDFLALHALDELGILLADPTGPGRDLAARMAELARGRTLDSGIGLGLTATTMAAGPARASQPAALPQFMPKPAPRPAVQPPPPAAAEPPRPRPSQPAPAAADGRPVPRRLSRDRARTPTGRALQAMLADGIAGISPMSEMELIDDAISVGPSSPPIAAARAPAERAPIAGPTAGSPAVAGESLASFVPIEALLYRGESALARARALSDVLRGNTTPTPDALAELYDLLDLAASA
jgi:Hpt domain